MRNGKQLVMAVLVAAGALFGGVTPQTASATVLTAEAVLVLPDGDYPVYENGRLIGYIRIRGGVVVGGSPPAT